ncbi:ABC transporter ATP-binding protein [Aerococcaceae bacterium NML210727]|nr:ABC transporter ATP-binding protein [Aerococcaceae bacterium NML210727]MCW6654155.1 ABC transporter ATP-binding protein [Aerococcaceae bacterium NML201296]MCW6661778.1 ABC transporter ATP-binding protein [Aerococcaceae bacterium NML201209]
MIDVINVQALNVRYQQTVALEQLSIQIPQTVRAAIVGPNGAGKSTFIKAILNLIPSQSQSIRLFHQPLDKVRHRVAYVPQTSQVNWQFPATVFDVVLMGISSKRFGFQRITNEQKERTLFALERMQLQDLANRQISQLSGGQKQRVFLARAMAQQAELYLLDEPLAGVDMKSEQLIMDYLAELQQSGKTSVTVHHDLNTVPDYFDYVVLLNKQLIAHGPTQTTFTPDLIALTYSGERK